MNLFELSYSHFLYQIITKYDYSLTDFKNIINDYLDLDNPVHIQGLLNWLNKWGCRHISIESHEELKNNLRIWWNTNRCLINSIETINEVGIIGIFNSLSAVVVTDNEVKTIKFGPTAAAKTLFILNSKYFIPWDAKIREDYGNSGASYYNFLTCAKSEICNMKKEIKISESEWNKFIIKRFPEYISDMKLMDEYYWITKTRNIQIDKGQIERLIKDENA